ncbi:hypothetical protein TruAng_011276 [Truncatella angustata]|nr:hypothetical protein TruAng_011276 [Truncatella angustata]
MFSIKYVVLHQVKSIFFTHNRKSLFHRVITILIWLNLLLYAALGLAFVFACTPREKIYHPMIEGRCISAAMAMSAGGALNIASDLSVLVIPLFGISKLQTPLKKKLLAGSVFAVGILYALSPAHSPRLWESKTKWVLGATAAATIRFYYGLQLFYTEDTTWGFMPIGNWTTIEFMMGFIVAGAPYVPRFVEKLLGRKKETPVYASYKISSLGTKNHKPMDRPDASWTALGEQEGMPFDGAMRSQATGERL